MINCLKGVNVSTLIDKQKISDIISITMRLLLIVGFEVPAAASMKMTVFWVVVSLKHWETHTKLHSSTTQKTAICYKLPYKLWCCQSHAHTHCAYGGRIKCTVVSSLLIIAKQRSIMKTTTTEVLVRWIARTCWSGENLIEMTGPLSSMRKLVVVWSVGPLTITPVTPPERTANT
jgi:hypothetical protein